MGHNIKELQGKCEVAIWAQKGFQDVCSPFAEELSFFHDYVLVLMTMILVYVLYSLVMSFWRKFMKLYLLEGHGVEAAWTIVPVFFLVCMGYPSLQILYALEEVQDVDWTIKVVGCQWYWNYEMKNYFSFSFDSFMLSEEDLEVGLPRLLEVDNRLVLPYNQMMRILITSSDVMHSWALPSLGVKMDAVPGRMNQIFTFFTSPGIYYGQCSEICGANHSFMPIVVESVTHDFFCKWCMKV